MAARGLCSGCGLRLAGSSSRTRAVLSHVQARLPNIPGDQKLLVWL